MPELERLIIGRSEMSILVVDHAELTEVAVEETCEVSDTDFIGTGSGLEKSACDDFGSVINLVIARDRQGILE